VIVFSDLNLKLVVPFVDIDGTVTHHCLHFLFITSNRFRNYMVYQSYRSLIPYRGRNCQSN
jgi:hypothetical protein